MEKEVKYDCIRIEAADNGFVLCYEVIKKEEHQGTYECRSAYEYKKEVYPWEGLDKAMAKMKALILFNKNKGEDSDEGKMPHESEY